jgi:threonine synthase
VILATAPLPAALAAQIAAYGAVVGSLEPSEAAQALRELLNEGWHPATSSDPRLSGAANPYGLEGYRQIAEEILAELGRPDVVTVPAASGDLFVGVVRGFRDLSAQSAPVVVACQPESAAALQASLAAGEQVALPAAKSIARSTSDPMSGRLALEALRQPGTHLVTVSEDAIAAATRELAACGLYLETSSALAYAGLKQARAIGLLGSNGVGVAVLTAQGRGWNEDAPGLHPEGSAPTTIDEVLTHGRRRTEASS